MKKQILSTVVFAAIISLTNMVNAEPVNCNCDCHKGNTESTVIEIGYPTKNLGTSAASSQSPSGTSKLVTQETNKANIQSQNASINSSGTTYTGGVSKVTAHFGNNVSDAEGNQIVNTIGRKLMKASGVDKNVYFVYSTEKTVNAVTEFNGTVTVYKGIMGCCENEDELAFVIGHELGHADGYHVAKSIAVSTGLNYGANEAAKALNKNISSKLNTFGLEKNTWSNVAVSKAQDLGNATYSKAHENDADLKAVDYLVKCGYNPLAGISVLNKLDGTYPDLFADHPSTDKRIQNIYTYVQEKYPQYISQGYNSSSYKQAYQSYIVK